MFKYVVLAQVDQWTFQYKDGKFSPKVFTMCTVTKTAFYTVVRANQ